MRIKTLSKFLTLGILLNSIPINSFAGILSEDTRYETFLGSNITINNLLEEDKSEIKIEGNTLVNHIDYSNLFDSRNNNITINQDNKEIFFNNTNNNISEDYTDSALYCKPMLKSNETYTVIFDIIENSISGEQFFRVLDSHNEYMPIETMIIEDNRTGLVKAKFTVKENNNGTFKIYLRNPNNQQNRGTIKIKNLMILEGDWTNKETPNYFEGLKSSFEDKLITQQMVSNGEEKAENLGKYKVNVKTTGKNKLNINMTETITANGVTINYNDDKTITLNGIATNAFPISITTEEIKYDMSKKYIACINVISGSCTGYTDGESWGLLFYPQDGFNLGIDSSSSYATKFYPNTESYKPYLWLGYDDNAETSSTFDNFTFSLQIVESSVKDTSYEPYKESINTFYLNSPLLEGDTIEYINGQATHIRRYNQVKFSGDDNEQWDTVTLSADNLDEYIGVKTPIYNGLVTNTRDNHILDNRRFSNLVLNTINNNGFDGKAINIHSNGNLYLRMFKSELINPDIQGFKEWLSNNPLTIVYKLNTHIYEPIKADLSVQLFEGATHISNNSNIPANMKVIINRTINRAVEAIELAKINPTLENLSKARMWTNLLDDSIKKDELQNEINDITDIEDLQLERKTVTSNIDVYVKSQNMLLMSLSTNSITFEDFSGVEDIVKENAINISINSSLPYNLNAYLATEIQNGDGTNIMNKDIFSIKENSELNYQTFSDVNNKLILKENCRSGNNQKHNIDLKLNGGIAHEKDIYKTVIKFEAEQQ